MKKVITPWLESCRIKKPPLDDYSGGDTPLNGAFSIVGPKGQLLGIIASDAGDTTISAGWEHVSVSCQIRTPNWEEMAFVKDLFFDEEECVMQFHPPKSLYYNHHPYCLHLWKPPYQIVLPPRSLL